MNDGGRWLGRPSPHDSAPGHDYPIGTPIEVRDRYCAAWSRGFEVASATRDGYHVRRLSDRYVLPTQFLTGEVRRAS